LTSKIDVITKAPTIKMATAVIILHRLEKTMAISDPQVHCLSSISQTDSTYIKVLTSYNSWQRIWVIRIHRL